MSKSKSFPKDTHTNGSLRHQNKSDSTKSDLKTLKDISSGTTDRHAYCLIASKVKSVINFVKVAYPDLVGGDSIGKPEPLNSKDRKVCRAKLLTCVERGLHAGTTIQEIVYDLDNVTTPLSANDKVTENKLLCNWDEKRIGKRNLETKHLQFESRFESGNLRKAIKVQPKCLFELC